MFCCQNGTPSLYVRLLFGYILFCMVASCGICQLQLSTVMRSISKASALILSSALVLAVVQCFCWLPEEPEACHAAPGTAACPSPQPEMPDCCCGGDGLVMDEAQGLSPTILTAAHRPASLEFCADTVHQVVAPHDAPSHLSFREALALPPRSSPQLYLLKASFLI